MRLIDADALSKDLEKRWNVNDDQDFCNKEVWHALEEAPTIEPDADTISIQMAIEHWGRSSGNLTNDQIAELQREIESLPSAPDSRQRGEWVGCTGCEHYDQQQTSLICHDCRRYYSDKYKGGEDE